MRKQHNRRSRPRSEPPLRAECRCKLGTFREVYIGATCRAFWGPDGAEGWDGSEAKDDFLLVLARQRDVLTEIWRSSFKANYRLSQSNFNESRDALDEENKVFKLARQCADTVHSVKDVLHAPQTHSAKYTDGLAFKPDHASTKAPRPPSSLRRRGTSATK